MFFKSWPNLSERSTWDGVSPYDGLQTDPYDDAVRLIDFHESGNTAVVRNYPKNWGTRSQAAAVGRPDPYVYPLRPNPLRTAGIGQDFSCCTLFPRRLLEDVPANKRDLLDSREYGDGRYASVTADSSVSQTMPGGTFSRNIDINMSNSTWQHGTRIGWNLIMTYAHYGEETEDPYFLCKDGSVQQFATEYVESLSDKIEELFPDWSSRDVKFMQFTGTPPSEDLVSIAKVAITEVLYASDRDGFENDVQGMRVSAASLSGVILTTDMQVCPGTTTSNASGDVPFVEGTPSWSLAPVAVWSGDSGSPLLGMSSDGTPWVAMVASFDVNDVNINNSKWWDCVNSGIENYSGSSSQTPPGESSPRLVRYYREWEESGPTVAAISGPLKPKRSEVAGSAPSAADLEAGELAINSSDRELFTKKTDGTVVSLIDRQADSYNILIESPTVRSNPGYVIDVNVVSDRTMKTMYAKTKAGQATIVLKRNSATVGSVLAVSSTLGSVSLLDTAVVSGSSLDIWVTAATAPEDLMIVVEYEQ